MNLGDGQRQHLRGTRKKVARYAGIVSNNDVAPWVFILVVI